MTSRMRHEGIGSYIRMLRIQKGLTQKELADQLNITDKAVSKWERSLSYPDIELFPALAKALGVTVGDLIEELYDGQGPEKLTRQYEMSPDLRVPLHVIIGCADLAEKNWFHEEIFRYYLDAIRLSGEYLLTVLNTGGRPEDGRADRREISSSAGKAENRNTAEEIGETVLTEISEKGASRSGQREASVSGQKKTAASGRKENAESVPGTSEEAAPFQRRSRIQFEEFLGERQLRREGPAGMYDFKGRRILVVEDIYVNREIVGGILEQTGAVLEFAEDGQVCLDKLSAKPAGYYDLILMDIMMPVMDGIESTRRIREMQDPARAGIPIIAMTANVSSRDRSAALRVGMNAFVEKPIRVDQLYSEMEKLLRSR